MTKTSQQIRQETNITIRETAEQFFEGYEGKHFRQEENRQHIVYKFQELKFHSYKGVVLVSAFVTPATTTKFLHDYMNSEIKLIPINIDKCYLLEKR